jgi:tetratricopeptide (TPR) repeat protein
MKTIDFSFFIERYNAGEMDEAEQIWFRKELEANKKLRDEVALRNKTDLVLKNQESIQLRNKLSEIEKKRAANAPIKTPGKNSTWKYAAVIAALVIIGSIALLRTRSMTNEEIISRFYKPYEGISASRSQQSVVNQDYSRALEYYNVRDFRNAAFYFGKVLGNDPKYMESTMYYGVSKYEESNYPEAVQKFRIVVDDGKNLYIEDAQWYLALCYLQTNEKELAISQLGLIKRSESIYSKPARKILRKMK